MLFRSEILDPDENPINEHIEDLEEIEVIDLWIKDEELRVCINYRELSREEDENRSDFNMTADEAKSIAMAILNPFGEGLDKEDESGDLSKHTDNFLD